MERTLILIKPDAVHRGLIGEIISRFEKKCLKLIAAKFIRIDDELAARHYSVHKGKSFYPRLISYITSGPVMAMVWEGTEAIKVSRNLMGATFGDQALPGTIRGDYSLAKKNVVHGSDSTESAEYEISLYFTENDFVDYQPCNELWVMSEDD